MPLPRSRLSLLPILLAALPTLAAAGPWQGSVETVDGVEHVHNPVTPSGGERSVEPEWQWQLGADEDADETELFGMIQSVLVDEQGNSYLLDMQLGEIRVFSPSGEFLRSIGRPGEGPGEFRNGMRFFFLPEGRIAVSQMMPSRIAVMDREGNGYADLLIPGAEGAGMRMVNGVAGAGDHCVISVMTPYMREGGSETIRALMAVDPDGQLMATYSELSEFHEGPGMRFSFGTGEGEDFTGQWGVDAEGRVVTAPMYDDYLLRVYASDGTLERVVHREYEHRKRSRAEIKEREEQWEGLPAGVEIPEINPYDRDIAGIEVRPDGGVWVRSSHNEAVSVAGQIGPFDRFDAEGRFIERLTVEADYDPERDDYVLTGERLFVIKEAQMVSNTFTSNSAGMTMTIMMGGNEDEEEDEGEPAPLSVISYRLPQGL